MSLEIDGRAFVLQLKSAINIALQGNMAGGLREQIRKTAEKNVYSYSPEFYSRRREAGGLIAEENLPAHLSGEQELTMQNTTGLQNLFGGSDGSKLTQIVENGDERYHMPYAREFMEPALDEYISSGEAEADLRESLLAAGFDLR